MNFTRVVIILCGMAFLAIRPAKDLWADSIYTWTDKSGIVHLTQASPPSGVAADRVMNNPPSPRDSSRPSVKGHSSSIWNWEVQQQQMEVRQAEQRLRAAEKTAQQAEALSQITMERSRQYIDTHDNNQYMRRAFKFQLRQAKNAANGAEAREQEARDQLKQAEKQYQAAQQQLKEAQEDARVFSRSD